MLTVKEAAGILDVTPQRVTQLIADGKLSATRRGNQWFIDSASVEARSRNVSKAGGRPKRGQGKYDLTFTLMSRKHELARVVYDTSRKEFTAILDIFDETRCPLGVFDGSQRRTLDSFNAWWRNRGIPATRSNLRSILADAGMEVPQELIMRNLGLSLSDQYWIMPAGVSIDWEDINFFNNSFEHSSRAIEMPNGVSGTSIPAHPDNTSDGNLQKHWTIEGENRVLLKSGGKNNQEPYNEVVATALHRRMLDAGEYVPYTLRGSGTDAQSACACFLLDTEEYVPAVYVDKLLPQRNDENPFQHYASCCKALGIADIERPLWKQMVCDDIIANSDRHYRNFGIIRNVESLECRMAPIFDSGTCLWCNTPRQDLQRGEFSYKSRQFEQSPARQMLLVEDMSWFSSDDLDGFVDEAIEILAQNALLEPRLPYIERALARRVERIRDLRDWA